MADITSSTYSVVTDSKSGDQYTIVRDGQLKKQTRTALDEHIQDIAATDFINLTDTPGTYVGQQGKVPQVNVTEDALEFVSSSLAPAFITLPDTPASYSTAGYFLKVNALSNGIDFSPAALTQLSDTPSSYTGQALNVVRVNAAETGIEYVDPAQEQVTGWASYSDSTYTSGSPLVVAAGTTVNLPNNAAGVIESFIPPGVTTLYDGSVITPENIGDAYEIRIDFTTSNSSVSGLADIIIDIGAPVGEILRRTFSFPKGAGTPFEYSTTTAFYSLDTFVANGGTININSITGNTSVWDIVYTIFRTHKGI